MISLLPSQTLERQTNTPEHCPTRLQMSAVPRTVTYEDRLYLFTVEVLAELRATLDSMEAKKFLGHRGVEFVSRRSFFRSSFISSRSRKAVTCSIQFITYTCYSD